MKSALKSSTGSRSSQAVKKVTLTSPTSSSPGGGYSKKFESSKKPLQHAEPPMMEVEKDKLVKRLMDKISEQVIYL